jgi:serine/threonine-protein kinase RIM15
VPRMPANLQKSTSSAAASPVKSRGGAPPPLALSPQKISTPRQTSNPSNRARSQTVGSQEGSPTPGDLFSHRKRRSQVFDMSPSSSDNEGDKANALLRVQRRRQSSRRMSQINLADGPVFRPLDVLICEDHPVSRMVMEKLLEKLRCRTITAINGAEAMRYAMSEIKFDIIMMEFKLPQINGADVARMIRDTKNANAQTPIVAVTGYLKELQAPHHFDALIEKPPTTSKLTDVLCRLCQWKAPAPSQNTTVPMGYPQPSGLRQESLRLEDSPNSGSSGYAHMPGSSFRGSSREDSISSSLFGDSEFMNDDVPVVISRKAPGDWDEPGGLGISNEEALLDSRNLPKQLPLHLLTEESAPGRMEQEQKMPLRQRSSEKMKAKRESIEKHRHECAESGDDEDEELGDTLVREKSPKQATKPNRGSKLGTEMMRTNSRGSVVSSSDVTASADSIEPPPTVTEELPLASEISGGNLTPPEVFTTPGSNVAEIDLNETPKPSSTQFDPMGEEPTPRAPSVASNRADYMSHRR